VATSRQGRLIDTKKNEEFSFDLNFDFENFKAIVFDEDKQDFYLLTNRYEEKLGLYLIIFNKQTPQDFKFLIKWEMRLDIGDCDIFILKTGAFKEMICSYKTIYLNIFNVLHIDIC
jgi:hypothetical protein